MVTGKLLGTSGNLDLVTITDAAVTVDGAVVATTVDATTDFTVDGLVLTADTITNDAALTITTGAGDISLTPDTNGDINIPADIGLTFGDDGEKIEGDGTDMTISGNNIKLAGGYHGIRYVQLTCVEYATAVEVADGISYFSVPAGLNGMNLVSVTGKNITAATGTGSQTTTIEVYNLTDTSQMLTTELTIDEDEVTSATAATAVDIDENEDDVATDDTIQINVSAIPSGAPEGLIVVLGFQLP